MAPESCQEDEGAEKKTPLSQVDQEPVSAHLEPPVGTPQEPGGPTCAQDTKPSSTRVVFSVNLQLAPESLDTRTLRLLWGQRELEIQALRWALQNRQEARHCHVLREVAGLPERSARNQEKFLQNQVQKLTLDLKKQKEQAQLEKTQLEERLLQTTTTMQQLEAELQAFQKSCLLQLARSSWVGRILRSSTGSVEVVTAETLMDFNDVSEGEQGPSTGEGFRLEDVDWNSIAQRYPNLFSNMESSSDPKHPRPLPPAKAPLSSEWSSELRRSGTEQRLKSVEWSSLPFMDTSSSGGADSDSSSGQLAERYCVRKVTGHPPCAPSREELTAASSRSLSREMQAQSGGLFLDLRMAQRDQPGSTVLTLTGKPCVASEHPHSGCSWSPGCSCLKIVAVSARERFVRVLNQSPEETADLGGLTLQQRERGFPVCMYRFPPRTLLPPRHHVTVWGEGPRSMKKHLPSSLGQEPVHFHSSRGCVTLLLNPKGEVLSEHRAAHCVSPASRIFADNTDLSIDRFPLSEAGLVADTGTQRPGPRQLRAGRVQEAPARRRRPTWAPRVPASPGPGLSRLRTPPPPPLPAGGLRISRAPRPTRTRGLFPRLSASKTFRPRAVPAPSEAAEAPAPELLPTIPEAGLRLEDCQARKEPRVRVCCKSVDRGCPMVALSVQSAAESRYGFRFLPCPPVTAARRAGL
ncbi:lamin tail domain-containing protein 2 isoform X2 [Mustela erminea]|uniref:lamin tail domain-containing protein 2 isoform X2 n=1 Tax=Mustela erminea TaxID=36723 RepID=UPI001386F61A|nr:lamin tail domain-containing protein 2 isoform X2 [Mustela erminea]